MFFLVILFLIFSSFFAIFRFPNLMSRLRLPRFNFANAFRNPKIKILLNDRYFFYQHSTQISKGHLFIVIGKNTDKLYETLLQIHRGQETGFADFGSWTERGQTEAFAFLTLHGATYLFVHPALMAKQTNEYFNSRTKFLISRLCKLRKRDVIDGVVLATQHASTFTKTKQTFVASDEVTYCSYFLEIFAKETHIRLPVFYVEHNFSETNSEPNFLARSSINYKNDEPPFSFFCDFLKKPSAQKYEDFLLESFSHFSSQLNLNFHYDVIKTKHKQHDFEPIAALYYVKHTNSLALKSFLIPCLKKYLESGECPPASISILNTCLFSGETGSDRLNNLFFWLSTNGIEKIYIPSELLQFQSRKNFLLMIVSCVFLMFFSFAIIKSERFLEERRIKFHNTLDNFKSLDNSMQLLIERNDDIDSLSELQEMSCLIIRNYADIKNISFKSLFLFPSWNSKISEQLQKKYKDKFSLIFSDFLFQKYSNSLDDFFELKGFPSDTSQPAEILKYIKSYVAYLSGYKDIYNQLDSHDPMKINKALILISKNIYENKCVEDEKSFDFLTTIDSAKFKNHIKPVTELQKQASKTLVIMMNKYFSSVLNNNTIMSAALNLNHDLKEFDRLVEESESHMNIHDDTDISGVKAAFEKSVADYKSLMDNFPEQTLTLLSSSNDFFGHEFVVLMDGIKKNQVFDSLSFSEINASSRSAFDSFKQKLDVSSLLKEKNNFPILTLDEKSNLGVNPKIINLFSIFDKLKILTNSIVGKVNHDDFHHIASMPTANVIWVDRKLQIAIQKYRDLQNQANLLEYEEYPESFSEYLQDYVLNISEQYWLSALSASVNIIEQESTVSNPYDQNLDDPDPHGLVSSANSLKQIVETLTLEHFDSVLSDFDEIYLRQVNDVLKQKTILFDKKELFGENADFKFWNGSTSLAYDIFYASSDETLIENLEKQKQILFNFYSQYIESNLKAMIPIIQMRTNLRSTYYNRWYSIYLAIDDKSKSYQNFTNFVLGDLKKFRLNDCPKILENVRDSSLISDYFNSRVEYFYGKLNDRCRSIYMSTAINGYDEFARLFNELLAGKYPFSRSSKNDSIQINADMQDLKRVLLQFQAFNKEKFPFLLKYNQTFSDRNDIINFVSQMTKVTDFFQLFLSKNSSEPSDSTVLSSIPRLNAYFVFRSRKNEEVLANHIIDWEVLVGEKHYGSSYGNLQNVRFSIEYGQPFVFSMKFANTLRPRSVTYSDSNIMKIIRGDTASFTFKTNWALIRFVDEYKVCPESSEFCQKDKLKFQIPLENDQNVVVFCDLILTDQEGNKVSLPSFPYRAPYFGENVENRADRAIFSSSNF